jgi:hypothetical protein
MVKCGIYKITNPNGKIYIGQSRNLGKRIISYKYNRKLISQPKIFNSIKKYGLENHFFEIIEECSFELLNERERYWQDFYNCIKKGLNCLYTKTNDKPLVFSKEMRQKMSKSQIGKKTVYYFDILGNFISKYDSVTECAKSLNISQAGVGACCRGLINTFKNNYFSYKKEFILKISSVKKPIVMYNLKTKEKVVYESLQSAIDYFGFKINPYTRKKFVRTKKGFIFYFKENESEIDFNLIDKSFIIKKHRESKDKIRGKCKMKKVLCIDDNTEFDSLKIASEHYKIPYSTILRNVNNLTNSRCLKKFKYV